MTASANRWQRFEEWDARPLRLDRFAREDPEHGLCAFASPYDPHPGVVLKAGQVVAMDGIVAAEFDTIDLYVARHHLDPAVVPEAMALDDLALARMLVDINVSRTVLQRLATGLTPAKLARVVAHLSAGEIAFAFGKMRQRRTPGNQAHVTNAKDDPFQLAADAATASAFGFDEIETTMRVASNAWCNALACTVGVSVGRGEALFQCSIEEAEELRIGLAGLASYAETVSVYGTEASFIDGDDTPWSKAFLVSIYASRGIKMRCTSGGGAELLMGFHERRSILYLEARCLCLQRAMGAQGTQNGGIDGAPVTASVPGGVRELMAENLMAAWLGLECASGNDTRTTESEIRVGAKIAPYLMHGSDLICSGFGSIKAYDNSFNASLFNGEEMEDFLVLQRDFEADGGLVPQGEDAVLDVRVRAVDALWAVLDELALARVPRERARSVITASGSDETDGLTPAEVLPISAAIRDRGLTALDVVAALARRDFRPEAERLMAMLRHRVTGDTLQTAAVVRDGRILSAINDPNDYAGPGTGYRMSAARWAEIRAIRGEQSRDEVLSTERGRARAGGPLLRECGIARRGGDRTEVVVGVSPGFATELHQTLAGHRVEAVLAELLAGVQEGGARARVVRLLHTADTSFLGLSAARLAGSGIGIGIQAKGTTVLHRADRMPHLNLELFSNAPLVTLAHYRALGRNAASYAQGAVPEPVLVPFRGEALGSRFHVRVALLYAIETALVQPGAEPRDMVLA